MKTNLVRALVVTLITGFLTSPSLAQEKLASEDSSAKTLRLLKAPETPAELWDAVKFSLNVGKAEQAASFLDRLLSSNPTNDLLLTIRERDGAAYFPKLSATPELRDQGAVLLQKAEKAAQERARDPERIQKFIHYLTLSPEHRGYGIAQLRYAGADAVPHLLAALSDPSLAEHRATILTSMQKLTRTAVQPLVAALATDDAALLADIITVLGVLGDGDTVPHLRYFAEGSEIPQPIQSLARSAVSKILERDYSELPAVAEALVAQATRYYEHRVNLHETSASTVRLWRWVPREGVKAQEVSASYAEQYFGLEHCRHALAIASNFEPAQILLLSLALEKAAEQIGIDQALPEGPHQVSAEALAAGPELLNKVLLRALDEGHPAVAVGALRALARTGNGNLLAPRPGRPSPLALALTAPDRRIQFAAADAVLSLHLQQPNPGTSQVVPILARALVAESAPKALVIDPDNARAGALSSLLHEAGYEAQYVPNAKEGFALAAESADYELIFIEPNIHGPNLSPTVAQLRADPRTASIPIILPGEIALQKELTKFEHRYPKVKFFLRPTTIDTLKLQLEPMLAALQSKPLTPAERVQNAGEAASWLARIARGEIRGMDPRPAESALIAVLGNDSLGPDAIAAVSLMPSPKSQSALARLIANESAAMPLRLEAAKQIAHSLRRFGVLLPSGQTTELVELLDHTEDTVFHQALAAVIGTMKPGVAEAGQRLRRYPTPSFEPGAAAAAGSAVPARSPAPPASPAESAASATGPAQEKPAQE